MVQAVMPPPRFSVSDIRDVLVPGEAGQIAGNSRRQIMAEMDALRRTTEKKNN